MGNNKGILMINLIAMFVLFLSLISIVFGLEKGAFFKVELAVLVLLIIYGFMGVMQLIKRTKSYNRLIKFYMVNFVNLLVIYFVTRDFSQILLPMAVSWIGFLTALSRAGYHEAIEEEKQEKKTGKETKKTERKTSKKKASKKSAKKSSVKKKATKKKSSKKKKASKKKKSSR